MGTRQIKFKHFFTEDQWFSHEEDLILLNMGGSAGHMQHPFDLPQVDSGRELLKVFEYIRDNIDKMDTSLKIDGINVAARVVGDQWALDRGSMKPLDVEGVTKDKLLDRFGVGHGLVPIGSEVLTVLNNALPDVQAEVKKLGLDQPNRLLNMEFVNAQTNVVQYANKFLAIHGVLEFEQVTPRRREAKEVKTDPDTLSLLVSKLNTRSQDSAVSVVGQVGISVSGKIDFTAALNQQITIKWDTNVYETYPLRVWLSKASNPVSMVILDNSGLRVNAMNKKFYLHLMEGGAVSDLAQEMDRDEVVSGAIMYHATRTLGREVLSKLGSAMGGAGRHEGIVIRDEKLSPAPVKITGDFIVNGMTSKFQK